MCEAELKNSSFVKGPYVTQNIGVIITTAPGKGMVTATFPPGQITGSGSTAEKLQYFYHPDHLGSTSYVTDASGEVYQHIEYFAYGETFVDEHNNTSKTPYLFNGKELDDETGLYYYGARYYDPKTSVWQSVDPLAEKLPGVSVYAYCSNNPIVFIDPDGKYYVGKDKSRVSVRIVDGKIELGKNATADLKRMVESKRTINHVPYLL